MRGEEAVVVSHRRLKELSGGFIEGGDISLAIHQPAVLLGLVGCGREDGCDLESLARVAIRQFPYLPLELKVVGLGLGYEIHREDGVEAVYNPLFNLAALRL